MRTHQVSFQVSAETIISEFSFSFRAYFKDHIRIGSDSIIIPELPEKYPQLAQFSLTNRRLGPHSNPVSTCFLKPKIFNIKKKWPISYMLMSCQLSVPFFEHFLYCKMFLL